EVAASPSSWTAPRARSAATTAARCCAVPTARCRSRSAAIDGRLCVASAPASSRSPIGAPSAAAGASPRSAGIPSASRPPCAAGVPFCRRVVGGGGGTGTSALRRGGAPGRWGGVGFVWLDGFLRAPVFRASEGVFQLLGAAAEGVGPAGRVIAQTLHADHYAL